MKGNTVNQAPLLALVALCTVSAFGAGSDIDVLLWSGVRTQVSLPRALKLSSTAWFRFNDNISEFYWYHTDISLTFAPATFLSIGANYWHVYKAGAGHAWSHSVRPKLNATVRLKAGPLSMGDRNMLEAHIPQSADWAWVYRNKSTAGLPREVRRLDIKPYVADEVFIGLTESVFSANRIYAGVAVGLLSWLALDGVLFPAGNPQGGHLVACACNHYMPHVQAWQLTVWG